MVLGDAIQIRECKEQIVVATYELASQAEA